MSPESVEQFVEAIARSWGTPEFLRTAFTGDAETLEYLARQNRASATPRTAAAQHRYMLTSLDARQALPSIQVPTLIISTTQDNRLASRDEGRYLAEHIRDARLIEVAALDDLPIQPSTGRRWAAVIAEFLTGRRPVEVERILTTVLFTDIVGSTERAASLVTAAGSA